MNNLNPDWKLVYVSLSELCDNDFNMMLKVSCLKTTEINFDMMQTIKKSRLKYFN